LDARTTETGLPPDSGLVALWLVASVHGERLDLGRIAHEFLAPGVPSTSRDLVRIARATGFRATVSTSSMKRLGALPLPVIATGRDGRRFVLARSSERGVLVADGASPPQEWTFEHLAATWTGEVVLVTRRETTAIGALCFSIAWFRPVIVRFRRVLAEVLLISAFIQLIGLVTPLFTQVVIDKVLVHRGLTTLTVIVVALVAFNVAEVLLGWLRTYTFSHTTSRMDAILGSYLFDHLASLPIAYFESRPTGQTVARVRELENIRQFITSSALTLVIDVVFGSAFLAVMAAYSTTLTLIVAASIPAYAVVSLIVTPGLRTRVDEKFRRGAESQSLLVESLGGIQTLKAMAVEPQIRARWDRQLAGYIGASFRVVTLAATGSQVVALINKTTTVMILWFGAKAVIGGEMTIGELVAFNMLAGHIAGPVLRLAQLWQDFQQFRLSIDRLADILDTPTEKALAASRQELPSLDGAIVLDAVTFRYKPGSPEVLKGLSLEIAAGEVVGIVGRSGSGKSTLTKLLQRLYVSEEGRVLVDGIDVSLMDPSWLRRRIGVVLQENVLFNRSIRDNIALADPSIGFDRVMAAAELAGAHGFVMELPNGYDTVLEERGSNLSGGQRQRIAIARALVGDPRILIFDEATSALDYESERAIQANMRSICRGRTVLIVAHRLSTVRNADRILVLDRGRLVESGPHDELVARGGVYADLVQAAG
jgi:subfamily B ATP-binding cassette protein HlyB/CyaB